MVVHTRNDDDLDWADGSTPGESQTEWKTICKGYGTLYYTNRDGGKKREGRMPMTRFGQTHG